MSYRSYSPITHFYSPQCATCVSSASVHPIRHLGYVFGSDNVEQKQSGAACSIAAVRTIVSNPFCCQRRFEKPDTAGLTMALMMLPKKQRDHQSVIAIYYQYCFTALKIYRPLRYAKSQNLSGIAKKTVVEELRIFCRWYRKDYLKNTDDWRIHYSLNFDEWNVTISNGAFTKLYRENWHLDFHELGLERSRYDWILYWTATSQFDAVHILSP